MNKARRAILQKVLDTLENAADQLETVLEEEETCLYNLPENMNGSERYEKMESAVDYLNNAISDLEDMRENIESAME